MNSAAFAQSPCTSRSLVSRRALVGAGLGWAAAVGGLGRWTCATASSLKTLDVVVEDARQMYHLPLLVAQSLGAKVISASCLTTVLNATPTSFLVDR